MGDMQDLIVRLESAEVGSRELDAAIADELDPIANQHDGYPGRWPFAEGSPLSLRTPAVTTSLDAALTLAERVLPGWVWMVEVHRDGRSTAWLSEFNAYGEGEQVLGNSPALALCIAILKAKAQGEGG